MKKKMYVSFGSSESQWHKIVTDDDIILTGLTTVCVVEDREHAHRLFGDKFATTYPECPDFAEIVVDCRTNVKVQNIDKEKKDMALAELLYLKQRLESDVYSASDALYYAKKLVSYLQ